MAADSGPPGGADVYQPPIQGLQPDRGDPAVTTAQLLCQDLDELGRLLFKQADNCRQEYGRISDALVGLLNLRVQVPAGRQPEQPSGEWRRAIAWLEVRHAVQVCAGNALLRAGSKGKQLHRPLYPALFRGLPSGLRLHSSGQVPPALSAKLLSSALRALAPLLPSNGSQYRKHAEQLLRSLHQCMVLGSQTLRTPLGATTGQASGPASKSPPVVASPPRSPASAGPAAAGAAAARSPGRSGAGAPSASPRGPAIVPRGPTPTQPLPLKEVYWFSKARADALPENVVRKKEEARRWAIAHGRLSEDGAATSPSDRPPPSPSASSGKAGTAAVAVPRTPETSTGSSRAEPSPLEPRRDPVLDSPEPILLPEAPPAATSSRMRGLRTAGAGPSGTEAAVATPRRQQPPSTPGRRASRHARPRKSRHTRPASDTEDSGGGARSVRSGGWRSAASDDSGADTAGGGASDASHVVGRPGAGTTRSLAVRVRVNALACIRAVARATPRLMRTNWWQFLPETSVLHPRPFKPTLFTLALFDQSQRVREAAVEAITAVIDGAPLAKLIALPPITDAKPPAAASPGTTTTPPPRTRVGSATGDASPTPPRPLSSASAARRARVLAAKSARSAGAGSGGSHASASDRTKAMVAEVHKGLCRALALDVGEHGKLVVHALRSLQALLSATPYERLAPGLVAACIPRLQRLLVCSDQAVVVATLQTVGAVVSARGCGVEVRNWLQGSPAGAAAGAAAASPGPTAVGGRSRRNEGRGPIAPPPGEPGLLHSLLQLVEDCEDEQQQQPQQQQQQQQQAGARDGMPLDARADGSLQEGVVRLELLAVLAKAARHHAEALHRAWARLAPLLLRCFSDAQPSVRANALRVIEERMRAVEAGEADEEGAAGAPADDPDPSWRHSSWWSEGCDPLAIPVLLTALLPRAMRDASATVRGSAAECVALAHPDSWWAVLRGDGADVPLPGGVAGGSWWPLLDTGASEASPQKHTEAPTAGSADADLESDTKRLALAVAEAGVSSPRPSRPDLSTPAVPACVEAGAGARDRCLVLAGELCAADASSVRAAACKVWGSYLRFADWRRSGRFTQMAASLLLRLLQDQKVAVRARAAWGLANAVTAPIDKPRYASGGPRPPAGAGEPSEGTDLSLPLLLRVLVALQRALAADHDRVASAAARATGPAAALLMRAISTGSTGGDSLVDEERSLMCPPMRFGSFSATSGSGSSDPLGQAGPAEPGHAGSPSGGHSRSRIGPKSRHARRSPRRGGEVGATAGAAGGNQSPLPTSPGRIIARGLATPAGAGSSCGRGVETGEAPLTHQELLLAPPPAVTAVATAGAGGQRASDAREADPRHQLARAPTVSSTTAIHPASALELLAVVLRTLGDSAGMAQVAVKTRWSACHAIGHVLLPVTSLIAAEEGAEEEQGVRLPEPPHLPRSPGIGRSAEGATGVEARVDLATFTARPMPPVVEAAPASDRPRGFSLPRSVHACLCALQAAMQDSSNFKVRIAACQALASPGGPAAAERTGKTADLLLTLVRSLRRMEDTEDYTEYRYKALLQEQACCALENLAGHDGAALRDMLRDSAPAAAEGLPAFLAAWARRSAPRGGWEGEPAVPSTAAERLAVLVAQFLPQQPNGEGDE